MIFDAKAARQGDALQDGHWAFAFKFKHVTAFSAAEVVMVCTTGRFVAWGVFRQVHGDHVTFFFETVDVAVDRCKPEGWVKLPRALMNFTRRQRARCLAERL